MALSLVLGWGVFTLALCIHLAGRRKTVLLIALAVILIPSTYAEVRFRAAQNRFSTVASTLTGVEGVHVYCQRLFSDLIDAGAVLGYVPYRSDEHVLSTDILLKSETCDRLRSFNSDPTSEDPNDWLAVHVLTHEAMHVAGLENEAQAECAAQQRDTVTASLLGADDAMAQRLAAGYRATGYPRLPETYQSPQCNDGAAWDEGLPRAPWPDQARPPTPWQPPFYERADPVR